MIKEFQRLKEEENNSRRIEWNVKRFLSKNNYLIQTDAVKNYLLPQKNYKENLQWLAYAEEADTMKKILSDIQDGTFAKEFLLDMSPAGRQVHFKAMRKLAAEHPSEKVGAEVRKLYSWNGEDKLINN